MKYAMISGGVITGLTGTSALPTSWNNAAANYEFSSSGTTTLAGTASAKTARYSGAGAVIDLGTSGANNLTLNGLMNVGSGKVTIQRTGGTGVVTIGSTKELVLTGPQNCSISAPIVDNSLGASAITMGGQGTLDLSAANTYTGGTFISSGTLSLDRAALTSVNAVTLAAGTSVTVNTGGTLLLNATNALGMDTGETTPVSILGGTMTIASGIHATLPGINMEGGTFTSAGAGDANGNYIIDGPITSNPSYVPTVFSANKITLRGNLNGTSGNNPVTFNVPWSLLVSSVIADTGKGLIMDGWDGGTLQLTGVNTYTGGTTLDSGTLLISADNNLGAVPNTPTTNITLGGSSGGILEINGTFVLNANRSINLTDIGGIIALDNGNSVSYGGTITGDAGASLRFAAISGTFTLTGNSTPTPLTAATSFYGNIVIGTGGSLNTIGASQSIPTGTLTIMGTGKFSLTATGGAQDFKVADGSSARTCVLVIQDNATFTAPDLLVGSVNGGSLAMSGAVNQNGGTVTLTPGGVGSTTTGLLMGGAKSTNTGIYNLSGGVLNTPIIAKGPGSGTFNFNGGTLRASASTTTFMQGLTTANIQNGGATIDTNGLGITINQALLNGGSGGLTVASSSGAGTLTLSGTSTYIGATNINAGRLVLSSTGVLGNTAMTVANNATFAPNPGSGSVNVGLTTVANAGASMNLQSGSIFDMTDGAIGTFNLQQNSGFSSTALTISGAKLNFDLSSTGADVLAVTKGALVSGSNTIGITTLGTSLLLGHTYNLITAASGLTGTFLFSNGGNSEVVTAGGTSYGLVLNNTAGAETITIGIPTGSSFWIGNGADGNWSNLLNWNNNLIPGQTSGTTSTDTATFNGPTGGHMPIVIDAGRNLQNITFDTNNIAAYTVGTTGGNALLLTNGGTIQTTSTVINSQVVNAPLVIEGANGTTNFTSNASDNTKVLNFGGAITVGAGGASVLTINGGNTGSNTISGTIGNGSATTLAITKSGVGTWIMTGSNTYTGPTNINSGKLILGATGSLGNTSIIVANGATFAPQPGSGSNAAGTTNASLMLNPGSFFDMTDGAIGTFNIRQSSSNGLTIGSASGTASTLTFEIGGANTGPDKIAVSDFVSVALSGAKINITPLNGITGITPGNYNLITSQSLSGSTRLALNSTSINAGGKNYNLALAQSGSNEQLVVTLAPASVVYWNGAASSIWSTLNSGTTNWRTDAASNLDALQLPTSTTDVYFTVNSGAANLTTTLGQDFSIKGLTFTGTGSSAASSPVTIGGANNLTIGSDGITVQSGSAAHTISSAITLGTNQTWTNSSTSPLTISGHIGGSANLTTAGTGTTILAGYANNYGSNYSGTTTISSGTLQVGNGSTNVYFGLGAGNVVNNSNLTFNLAGPGYYNGLFSFNGYATPSISGSGTITVNMTSSGVLFLNDYDTYTGKTVVNSGYLAIDTDNALGTAPASYVADQLTLNGGVLTSNSSYYYGYNTVIASTRGVTLGANGGYLGAAPGLTINSIITGSGALTIINNFGAVTLANPSNTYAGSTTIGNSTYGSNAWGSAILYVYKLSNGGIASSIGQSSSAASNLVFTGGLAELYYLGGGDSTNRLFTLSGNGFIDSSGTGALNFTNSGDIAFTGAGSSTLNLGGSYAGVNTFAPTLSDNGAYVSNLAVSGSTWNLIGVNTYSGSTNVSNATLILSKATGTLASTAFTLGIGGTLVIDNTGTGNNNNNRIADNATMALNGGNLVYKGSDVTNSTETVGTLNLSSSSSTVTITAGSNNTATLTAASLNRTAGQSTALINGVNLGQDANSTANIGRMFVTTTPLLVGTTAALDAGLNAAAQNTQIVPFLVGEASTASGGLGTAAGTANTFLTYNPTTGLRPLNPIDEFTNNAIIPGNNTRVTSATTAANTASINSLVIAGGDLAINDTVTLTDASGALLITTSNAIKPTNSSGVFNFGGAEGIVTVNSGVTGTIGVGVMGSGGLTKNGAGTLVLTGLNAYAGATNINAGTLQIGNGGTTGTLASGVVTDNSTLIINRSDTLNIANTFSGSGSLVLTGSGTVILTNGNSSSFSGTTTINAGTLQVGSGGTTGVLGATYNIVNNYGSLVFNHSDTYTLTSYVGGTGSVTQEGSGTLLVSRQQSYTGSTIIKSGTVEVASGGLSSLAYMLNPGTTLRLDGVGLPSNSNMSFNSASLVYAGSNGVNLGTITLVSGFSTVTATNNGTSSSIYAAALNRTAGQGTALVNGINLGASISGSLPNILRFNNSAPLMVGTTAALNGSINAAVKNTKIVPFLVGEAAAVSGGLGTATGIADTFLTHQSNSGLRPLNPIDEFTNNAIISSNNTRITTATTANANASINSLIIAGGDLSINDNVALTNTSGALLFTTSNAIKPTNTTGIFNFGAVEGLVTVNAGVTGTISADITGNGGLTKSGTGTLILSGSNSYTGATTINAGAVQFSTTSTNQGPSQVSLAVSIDGTFATAPAITRNVSHGSTFANLGSTAVGGEGTQATILFGTNNTGNQGGTVPLTMQWVAGTGNSDVLNLSGMNISGTTSQTDSFVLQMTYNPGTLSLAQQQQLFLAWLDNGTWVNAIDGNYGTNTGGHFLGAWSNDAAHDSLGAWGVDTTNDMVWAVLNHNSQFEVGNNNDVPEPMSVGLLGLGAVGLLLRHKKKRHI